MSKSLLEIERLTDPGEPCRAIRITYMDESLRASSDVDSAYLGTFGDWEFRSSRYPEIRGSLSGHWIFYLWGDSSTLDDDTIDVPIGTFNGLVRAIAAFNSAEATGDLYDELFGRSETDA